jgi:8-oxo-dGTP diphosphatase
LNEPSSLVLATPWVNDWQPEFIGTLIFIMRDDQVLLIHKKTGHGAGKINAPGGKLEPGEGIVDCACRELFEEVGLLVSDPRVGVEMRFVERNGPQWLGFALTASQFGGTLTESVEAKPFWCPLTDIPYDKMWPDDRIWLPRLLAGDFASPVVVDFLFDDQQLKAHQFSGSDSIWAEFGT